MPTDDDNNNIALIGRGESVLDANGHAVGDNKQVDTQTTIKESDEENVEDAASKEQDEINRIEALEPSSGYGCQKIKLDNWDPENENQWNAVGKSIATRNLIASIPNLTCAFGVWLVWSVIVSKIQLMHDKDPDMYPFQDWGAMDKKEYKATLYLLPAVAGLSGGTLRIPNSFLTQVGGGRNVVYSSSVLLCIPMLLAGIALSDKDCPFSILIVAALLSGVGGGAFASSMSNISFFYPKRQQGYALGMNGGLGNLGVSLSQLLAPVCMNASFGKSAIGSLGVLGWPGHAGWLWFPICAASAVLSFFWMNNMPHHGAKSTLLCHVHYYWMEILGMIAAGVGAGVLFATRDSGLTSTPAGQIGQKFILVIIVAFVEHIFMWFVTPPAAKVRVHKQATIFKEKHTYIMTWLYIMCFGSFIGYSGSFPKLITDLFGYVGGCEILDENGDIANTIYYDMAACEEAGATFEDVTNPNAPDVFTYAWMGAAVGSLIRPVGGVLSDKFGGAKVTMIMIVWCTIAAFAQGALVAKTRELEKPEENFGWFVFLFLNLFFTTGSMNGSTFRTIGVLFPPEESGPVLGWSSAIASYGAFIIPSMFGVALKLGRPENTFYCLGGYYVSCAVLNFWYYVRPGCEKPGV